MTANAYGGTPAGGTSTGALSVLSPRHGRRGVSTAAPAGHRCAAACRCPVHRTALYYWPASDLHACQHPTCRHAKGVSAETLAAADQGERMHESDPSVFARFLDARRADPERVLPPAVPLDAAIRHGWLDRPTDVVPESELRQLLAELPEDPTLPGYDEDQALGRLAMAAEALRMALDVREAEAADRLAGHDGELHHLSRRVLDAIAVVLTQHEPSVARTAAEPRSDA
ncbi:hypothetical protein [Streptomyces sp. NPDC001404]|uniref:hypothetical protein n=1 Tax=Streptomyces sp. NPDC001404 TaxID=3364571 RepID=UPI00369C184E